MFTPSSAGVGTHTITYDFVDANNCSSSAQDNIVVNPCLGFEDENENLINIYPNPASNFVNINSTLNGNDISISLINDLGQVIQSVITADENFVLNIENFGSGVYYIRIIQADKIVMKKLIIQ